MELISIGQEYMVGAEAINQRIAELKGKLRGGKFSDKRKYALRRRIAILDDLRHEMQSTGRYLQNYYKN